MPGICGVVVFITCLIEEAIAIASEHSYLLKAMTTASLPHCRAFEVASRPSFIDATVTPVGAYILFRLLNLDYSAELLKCFCQFKKSHNDQ